MATLKICTHDRTQWLLGVRRVMEQRAFSVPKDDRGDRGKEGERAKGDAILRAALGGDDPSPHVVNLTDFSGESVGKVLQISFERDDTECWIVPANSCFLMSDTGKTIDRI